MFYSHNQWQSTKRLHNWHSSTFQHISLEIKLFFWPLFCLSFFCLPLWYLLMLIFINIFFSFTFCFIYDFLCILLCYLILYYEFNLLHIFSLVLQPWMSAYIRKTDGVYISVTYILTSLKNDVKGTEMDT